MFLAGSIQEVSLSNGQKAYYANVFKRENQRNMNAFNLPNECLNKNCFVRFDYEVMHTNNMKTSMNMRFGGGLSANGAANGGYRQVTNTNGVNGGWRPAVGTRDFREFNVTPTSAGVTIMQYWTGSGGASSGHYIREGTWGWYRWSVAVYWN